MKKILIISGSGMGCTIMFTPTLHILRERYLDAQITFLGISKAFVAPVRGCEMVDKVVVFDFAKNSLFDLGKLGDRLGLINKLRKQKFDISITVFPSNKWFFNVFAWLIGAKRKITHSYSTPGWKTLAGLQNAKVTADPKKHDVEQNLALLAKLNISLPAKIPPLHFHITAEDKSEAQEFCNDNLDSERPVVGMHIGSSQDFSFASKRWSTAKFAELADNLQQDKRARVVLFAGPEEDADMAAMRKLMKTSPLIAKHSLGVTAALIERCDVMVANDSGLMHIAVAMQTPVVAIFGPTSLTRTRPYTDKAVVVSDDKQTSFLKYPFTTTSAKIDPELSRCSFNSITVDKVMAGVNKVLDGKL